VTAEQDTPERVLPYNFSWLNRTVAASSHPGYACGLLDRTLEALKKKGIGCIVSLAPIDRERVKGAGLTSIELDTPDMGVPPMSKLARAIDEALKELGKGKKLLVHCGAGYGRTGMFLACLLVSQGLSAEDAIELVRSKRPGSIETKEQEELVYRWEKTRGS